MLGHLLLLESFNASVAVGYILCFTVVQEWPLAKPSWLERTHNYFLLPKRTLGKVEVPRLMRLFGNILRHGDAGSNNTIDGLTVIAIGIY